MKIWKEIFLNINRNKIEHMDTAKQFFWKRNCKLLNFFIESNQEKKFIQ